LQDLLAIFVLQRPPLADPFADLRELFARRPQEPLLGFADFFQRN